MRDSSISESESASLLSKKVSRRDMLKTAGIGGVGILIGAAGIGGVMSLSTAAAPEENKRGDTVPFYGAHQAGIVTAMQDNLYFASLEITTTDKRELIKLFKDWTVAASNLMKGKPVGDLSSNGFLPPKDTGEAEGLSPANLTITFGVGPSLFVKNGQDRFGLRSKQPKELKDLPKFSFDALDETWCGGDICIQACADDPQVAFHAVRNLVRIARGKLIIHWAQTGFQRTKSAGNVKETPRNLFGFKDGTVNPDSKEDLKQVWVQPGDGPNWLVGGSYMAVRRIQMYIEVWDRTTLKDQEETFGRKRMSGAPLGKEQEFDEPDLEEKDENGKFVIPETAHMRLARGDGTQQLLRRSYSYAGGMDPKTGSIDAGLLFIAFQRTPSKQFIPMQQRLAGHDKLNEYIIHRGSAIFACLPGVKKGGYIGETLFN